MSSKFLDMDGLKVVLAKVGRSIESAHADATLPATPETTGLVRPGDGIDVDEDGTIAVRIVSDDEIDTIWDEVKFDVPDREQFPAVQQDEIPAE